MSALTKAPEEWDFEDFAQVVLRWFGPDGPDCAEPIKYDGPARSAVAELAASFNAQTRVSLWFATDELLRRYYHWQACIAAGEPYSLHWDEPSEAGDGSKPSCQAP